MALDEEDWGYLLKILSLPGVPLSRLDLLPNCSALYFITCTTNILYIGCTDRLRSRWINHHKLDILRRNWPKAVIRYEEIESAFESLEKEQQLIRHFQPPLNRRRDGLFEVRYTPIDDNHCLSQFVDLCLRPMEDAIIGRDDMSCCFVAFCEAYGYKPFRGPKFSYLLEPHLPGCRHHGDPGKNSKYDHIPPTPPHWRNVTPLPGVFAFDNDRFYCNIFCCIPGGVEAFGSPQDLRKWCRYKKRNAF